MPHSAYHFSDCSISFWCFQQMKKQPSTEYEKCLICHKIWSLICLSEQTKPKMWSASQSQTHFWVKSKKCPPYEGVRVRQKKHRRPVSFYWRPASFHWRPVSFYWRPVSFSTDSYCQLSSCSLLARSLSSFSRWTCRSVGGKKFYTQQHPFLWLSAVTKLTHAWEVEMLCTGVSCDKSKLLSQHCWLLCCI